MNRDPQAWARLGRALRDARERQGSTQAEVAARADVSTKSVQEAEAGKVPRARMPYTIAPVAQALGWPGGAVEAVLEGADPPGGWRDKPVQIDSEAVAAIIGQALIRATDNITTAEIRHATQIAVDELRRRGLIPDVNETQSKSTSGNV